MIPAEERQRYENYDQPSNLIIVWLIILVIVLGTPLMVKIGFTNMWRRLTKRGEQAANGTQE